MSSLLCLGEIFLHPPPHIPGNGIQQIVFPDRGIPCSQVSGLGVFTNMLPICTYDCTTERFATLAIGPYKTACHNRARHQPFQVPFPWAWERLIEIVDAEDQIAF